MKNEPAISIVVPVYNVEKYLHACMKSLLAQTFTDFEVILVDDASPDNSGKICDEFAKKDARVRVVHLPENLGVTAARKAGIEVARGEWVSFVDSDDTLPANAMETLILGADDETDLVAGECLFIRGETKIPTEESNVLPPPQFETLTPREFCLQLLSGEISAIGPWAKLFRRKNFIDSEILDLPRDFTNCEDVIANFRFVANHCRKVKKTKAIVYYYIAHEGSATNCCIYESYIFRFFDELKKSAGTLLTPADDAVFAKYCHKFLRSTLRSPSPFTPSEWAKRIKPACPIKSKAAIDYWRCRTKTIVLLKIYWKIFHPGKMKRLAKLPVVK